MIGILDYGMGNLRSVRNAVTAVGFEPTVASTAADLKGVRALIIPGVGAFAMAMANLRARGLEQPVLDFVAGGSPVLGICLGMQILASTGTEPTNAAGLALIPGTVDRLPVGADVRLPHVGWNNLELQRDHPVLGRVKANADFYFVHSFCFTPMDPSAEVAATIYGVRFTSVVAQQNVIGTQFHPEKSQESGLRLLKSFCEWDGRC